MAHIIAVSQQNQVTIEFFHNELVYEIRQFQEDTPEDEQLIIIHKDNIDRFIKTLINLKNLNK